MKAAILSAVRDGTLSFNELSKQADWARMARYVMRRWQPPSGVTEDDVVQELLLGAWKALQKFDPERGTPIQDYVSYNAISSTKKWIHRQRSAGKDADRGHSHNAIPFSALGREDRGDVEDRLGGLQVPPQQEILAEAHERLGWCGDPEVVAALVRAGGDVLSAVDDLCEERGCSERVAEIEVREVVSRISFSRRT
jgi:hypothetical protein